MAPRNKLLLRNDNGVAMVAQVVAACAASSLAQVEVVTGYQAALIELAVRETGIFGIRFVHASDHRAGLSASLRAGIAALPAHVDAVLVCLGDMPLIGATLINQLISALAPAQGRYAVVPLWQGQRGNPVLLHRRFFADMLDLSGDTGARVLLERDPEAVMEIDADGPGVITDFDTEAEWRAMFGVIGAAQESASAV